MRSQCTFKQRLVVLVLSATAALNAGVASAAPRQVPGGRIVIDAPDTFKVAKQFAGFLDADSGASIVTVEMPVAAIADFKASDFAARLAANGFAKVVPGRLERKDEHLYVTAEQASAAGAIAKYLLIFVDARGTAMITVNILKSDLATGKRRSSEIEQMLQTAALANDAAAPIAPDFTLSYLGPFKAAGTLGGASLYTLDGKGAPDQKQPGRPLFVVAPSLSPATIVDLASTSTAALASMFDLTDASRRREGAVSIGGLEGYEIECEAPRKPSGPRAAIYQVMLRTKDGYMRMVGTGPAEDAATLLPQFRMMAASFKSAPAN